MATDILSTALIQSMARKLSVTDLIRTTESLKNSGQTDSVETLYSTWIQHNQDNPLLYAILFNHSVALSDSGKLRAAGEALERAITLNPEFMPAYINLGRICERLGNPSLALVHWSIALAKLGPVNGTAITHKTTALNQSARALEAANQDDEAELMLRQSLDLDCHQREVSQHLTALRQRQCKWPVVEPWERVSRGSIVKGMSPLSAAAYTDDPLFHLALASHYNQCDVGTLAPAMTAWPKAMAHKGPLRIGYLSSDLREHAVGYLMHEILGLHDRSRVEIFVYYCGLETPDPQQTHFKDEADHWLSINSLDDQAAAHRIAEDGIQILVDLNGYTREARLKVFALRPAPVIVNWLGYPGTMASPYHHYLIADDWIIPEEHALYFSEKVLRLPCYQPNNRKRVIASTHPTRTEAGLPEDGMVYCCFNGTHKISRFTFDRWLMILAQVPGSVLWLLGCSDSIKQRLRTHASERGVAPERLVFCDKMANPYHLARYVLADLFLDSSPYGAHTTASDALWMGVPMLTLSGRSFASRVCGSLVRAAGLPELVCTSPQEFVEKAVAFGRERTLLAPYRQRLTENRDSCVLFDMPLLTRSLEGLYAQMWEQALAGSLPTPDLDNLDTYLQIGSQILHEELELQTVPDYHGWWLQQLSARHKARPVACDRRLVTDREKLPAV